MGKWQCCFHQKRGILEYSLALCSFADKGPSSQIYDFSSSHVWIIKELIMRVGSLKRLMPKNWCFQNVVLEKTLESPLDSKEIKAVNPKGNHWISFHWKDWCWSSNTLATWCKQPTYWKRLWCCERLRTGGKGDNRGWDSWMESLTQWKWVWANSRESEGQGSLACCSSWGTKSWTQLSD